MHLRQQRPIPAFLSFDVEPDAFQLSRAAPPEWDGYSAMFEFSEQLRSRLTDRSGAAPKFGWYFRTDPQIAEVYGRPDYVLATYPQRMAHLEAKGDYFGVHAHPIRWCAARRAWIHDFGDAAWHAHVTRFSLEAYAGWAGSPAQRFRSGAGFLTNEIVEVLDRWGVQVELSLEPVAGWGLGSSNVPTAVDTSPLVGTYTDCRAAPRLPFHPAHHDFRVPGGRSARNLVMVPLTTGSVHLERPLWWRIARRIVRGARVSEEEAKVFYPGQEWPSAEFFWDLVSARLRSMRQPYLSLGVRTDTDDSKIACRVRRLFEALPDHPLSACLRFVDPLPIAPTLIFDS
jgi:hypothetical protein